MYRATQAELQQYEELGFFCREGVFSPDELVELRSATENVHKQVLEAADCDDAAPIDLIDNQKFQMVLGSTIKWEWRDDLRAIRSMEPTAHLDARFEALVDDPRLWQPSADIIGSDELSLFSDKLNVKRPGGAPFPWHQEGPYWAYGAEDLEHIVSALTYIDEGTEENGCLWIIPGSHRHGALQNLKNRGVLGALYTDVELVDEEAMAVAVPAGSVLWFHRDIVHGSQSNRADTNRRVFVTAYQPAGLHRWRLDEKRDIKRA